MSGRTVSGGGSRVAGGDDYCEDGAGVDDSRSVRGLHSSRPHALPLLIACGLWSEVLIQGCTCCRLSKIGTISPMTMWG